MSSDKRKSPDAADDEKTEAEKKLKEASEDDLEDVCDEAREKTRYMREEMNCTASSLIHRVGVVPEDVTIQENGLLFDYGPICVTVHFDGSLSTETGKATYYVDDIAKRVKEALLKEEDEED